MVHCTGPCRGWEHGRLVGMRAHATADGGTGNTHPGRACAGISREIARERGCSDQGPICNTRQGTRGEEEKKEKKLDCHVAGRDHAFRHPRPVQACNAAGRVTRAVTLPLHCGGSVLTRQHNTPKITNRADHTHRCIPTSSTSAIDASTRACSSSRKAKGTSASRTIRCWPVGE